nr:MULTISPECIES: TetR/AcrR family transcriptional regulator [Ramlibacter]
MAPADRERQILDGAIAYFAEAGFSGQTRELSKRLGITQPLLYRYFASKQALIERVYDTVFAGRWDPEWIGLVEDHSLPLRERLVEFYRRYAQATHRPEWIRIYLHAGLSNPELNRRYIQLVRRELLPAICRELRRECGVAAPDVPVSEAEIEFVWTLHGGIFYQAVRRHVYKARIGGDVLSQLGFAVDSFLAGARTVYPRLLAQHAPQALEAPAPAPVPRRRKAA